MPTHATPADALMTAREVRALLGIDRSTVYRMAADGRLPSVRIGKQLRFPRSQIRQLLHHGGTASDDGQAADASTLVSPRAAQAAIDVAAPLLGVMMVVTDLTGRPITRVANPCQWFTEHGADEQAITGCLMQWQAMAEDTDLAPQFQAGHLGFECARALIRDGSRLTGMVIAGGVNASDGSIGAGSSFFHLDAVGRARVLTALPQVAAAIAVASRPGHPNPPMSHRSAQEQNAKGEL